MPVYEYLCRKCGAKYELLRPMAQSDEPATCPNGHPGGVRTLSVFASVGRGSGGDAVPSMGGGCACGGACSCGGH